MRMVTLIMEPEHQSVSWSIIVFSMCSFESDESIIQNRQRPSWLRYFGKVGMYVRHSTGVRQTAASSRNMKAR